MVFSLLALFALAAGSPSEPKELEPTCSVARATVFVRRFADLPKAIRDDILRGGAIAEAGDKFTSTDAVTDPSLPTRRFVLAGESQGSWFVWIDHGGFGRHYHVLGYMPVYEGKAQTPRPMLAADFIGEPCEAINAFFRGVMTNLSEGEGGGDRR
jgi:hypothetical protein